MAKELEARADERVKINIPEIIGTLFQYAVDREAIQRVEQADGATLFRDHVIRVPEYFMKDPLAILDRAIEVYKQTMTLPNPNPDLHRALSRVTPRASYEDALRAMTEVAMGICTGDIGFMVDGKGIYSLKQTDESKA